MKDVLIKKYDKEKKDKRKKCALAAKHNLPDNAVVVEKLHLLKHVRGFVNFVIDIILYILAAIGALALWLPQTRDAIINELNDAIMLLLK